MYSGAEMVFPYFQNFSREFQQLEEFLYSQKSSTDSQLDNLIQSSIISEYDFGGVSDLFKAPEPIMEEPTLGVELDPLSAAVSMISCGSEDVITPQGLKVSDLETIQNEQLLDVFYECEKDLLAQTGVVDMSISDSSLLDIKTPLMRTEEATCEGHEKSICEGIMLQKSVSSGCLGSTEWVNESTMKPNFMDFPSIDFGSVYGMRRAFSEGDIKTLSHGNVNPVPCPLEQPVLIGNQTIEERREKLNRYRNKKTKRNFGRKIKYACRKALADSQPRIRGRFAKTEESDICKKQ